MSKAKDKRKDGNADKAKCVTLAQEMHVDTDLRRLAEACAALGEAMAPFIRRVRAELARVKEGEQEGLPQIPLFVHDALGYKECKTLFQHILPAYPFLRVIQLHHCGIGDESVLVLVEFIKSYSPSPDRNPFRIESLELPGCGLTVRGATYLAPLLRESSSLSRLVLDFNPLGDAGATALSEGLRWNNTLYTLSLQYCGIAGAGAAALARHVVQGSGVRELGLRGNPLGEGGVRELARALCLNLRLEQLDIADTNFGGNVATLEMLCAALERCPVLRVVDMDYNTILPAALPSLVQAVQKNTSIVRLVLSDRIDTEVYQAILEAVARNAKLAGGNARKGRRSTAAVR